MLAAGATQANYAYGSPLAWEKKDCNRVSLTIIGAGFRRTGTRSTQFDLNELGYFRYHMKEIAQKATKNHLKFWVEVAESPENTLHHWNEVFHNYSATVCQ